MKTAGFRFRVEPELRDAFVKICSEQDMSAAQVLRRFMRDYIEEGKGAGRRGFLFAAEKAAEYNKKTGGERT